MRFYKQFLLLICAVLSILLLVGCGATQPTNDQPIESTNSKKIDNASKNTLKQEEKTEEVPTAEPDQKELEVTQGPKLTVNLPTKMSTDYENLKVAGSTEPGSTVFVNGQTVRLKSDGTFSSEIVLNPGNNVIEVIAVDNNSNSTQVNKIVNFSASKPTLNVFAPSESATTNVTISGYTDPNCVVYLDGNKVKSDKNGGFTGTVKIKKPGNNDVKITAVNNYGVSTETTKNIRGVAPKVQVAAPELTTNDKATISGVTDGSSSIVILIGSEQVSVNNNDGTFSISIDLEPGLNDLTVLATNLFGTTETPLTILYDDYGK
jgi:hypothetical protein